MAGQMIIESREKLSETEAFYGRPNQKLYQKLYKYVTAKHFRNDSVQLALGKEIRHSAGTLCRANILPSVAEPI